MTAERLARLLRPKSIAVFGGRQAAAAIRYTTAMGFTGDIWPVHPTKAEVEGRKAFRSVADLPDVPDAAFVAVNRDETIKIVKALSALGAGGAFCYAAGFTETAMHDMVGAQLQQELVAAASDMNIVGPNCNGMANYADGAILWSDAHGGVRLPAGSRGVAIITQSGSMAANLSSQKRGLPLAFLLAAGNQAQTGISELALAVIEDERVSALGLHIEGFDCVLGFEKLAARSRELGKPIVSLKVGRSEQARRATVSHTASLAGSAAASAAFLKRLGMGTTASIPSFLEALKLLHVAGPLQGYRLSSMGASGGEVSVMADAAIGRIVHFPAFTEQHHAHIRSTLRPLISVSNPLDFNSHIWFDEAALTRLFSAVVSGGFDFSLLVLDFPRGDRCTNSDRLTLVHAFEVALKAHDAKGGIVSTIQENIPEEVTAEVMARGIVPLCGFSDALDAIEAAAAIGAAWREPPAQATDISAAAPPASGRRTLDESEAKAKLLLAGLAVPQGKRVGNATEAAEAARSIGFPVALKALGVAHKSEVGAVRLKLRNAAAVADAARDLSGLGTGLYVERMVENCVAELIVGFTRDPLFGQVMTLGTGGVLVELLRDVATVLLPTTRANIGRALRSLRLYPLLEGYRGRPKADVQAAIDAIARIAEYVRTHADEINELDINPLIVCAEGQGAWIADSLMVCTCR